MSLKVCIVGTGDFAQQFIPLFKAHPCTAELSLCDLDAAKLAQSAERFGAAATYRSLEEACESHVDAVALFTQNWAHGPQAAQALCAGKHVYSAVPAAISLEELRGIVCAARDSGRTYMLGETSYYYPAVIYARQRFEKGDFGHVVYAEGNYYHDFDHGLYEVKKRRGGADWRRYAGSPPMHYPSHSTGSVLGVTGARLTHVSCQGWVDRHEDGLFREDVNKWGNVFSNQSALCRAGDGSMVRINEFRRIGGMGGERSTILGTEASFEHSQSSRWWLPRHGRRECVDELLSHKGIEVPGRGFYKDVSKVHPIERLPASFAGLPNGHAGSHQFLVDDFLTAVSEGRRPPLDAATSMRFCTPGLIAHESARRGGELMQIPDLMAELWPRHADGTTAAASR